MAYTKSPTTDTHNVVRVSANECVTLQSAGVGFAGPPSSNTYVNCYPIKEDQWEDNPVLGIHKRDGWEQFGTPSGTNLTGTKGASIAQVTNTLLNYAYYTCGTDFGYVDYTTGGNTVLSSAGLQNYRGTICNAIDNTNTRKMACLEGGGGVPLYLTTCNENGTALATTDLSALVLDGSKGLVFINGYLFALNTAGTRVYNSNPGGNILTWNATNFLDAEQYADLSLYIDAHKNYLVVFGTNSIEFFYDNGTEVGSPLARQESYSSRVGLLIGNGGSFTSNRRFVARYNDDLYFVGKNDTALGGLYRIKDFRVEELDIKDQYVKNIINHSTAGLVSVFTCWLNNNPCIVLEFLNNNGTWAYMIETGTWVKITGSDFPTSASYLLGLPFITANTVDTGIVHAMWLSVESGQQPKMWRPTRSNAVSVSSTFTTKAIDFGTNRYKHLARVDAVGDFNTNTLTLAYGSSNNYSAAPTSCGSQTSSTIGYANNVSWYNLGAHRQFYLQFSMVGTQHGIFRAFDIEYDVGVA